MSDYDDQREKRRQEQREYERDVNYEVWRSGGNSDRVNPDRLNDHYYEGKSVEEAARYEIQKQRPKEPEQIQEQEQICGACGCSVTQWGCGCNPHDA